MGIFRHFPYTNFHELNEDWIIKEVKQLIVDWSDYQLKWKNLYNDTKSAFDDFKKEFDEHIASYDSQFSEFINSINVDREFNQALNRIITDGTFSELVNPIIISTATTETRNWLNNNISPSSEVVIDRSLKVAGACADAQAAGDGIRTLNNKIDGIGNITPVDVNAVFTQGKGITSAGKIFNSGKRIATESFINIQDAGVLDYSIDEGYRLYIATYGQASDANFISSYGWLTGSGFIKLRANERYCRMCLAYQEDAVTLAPSNYVNKKVSYNYKIYNGLLYKGAIPANADINNYYVDGIYSMNNNNNYSNIPDLFTGGTLFVFESYNQNYNSKTQFLISPYNKNIWMRYLSGSGVWQDWIALSGSTTAEQTNWLAIGDSITLGVYSYLDSQNIPRNTLTIYNWVNFLSEGLNYNKKVMASRGIGYCVTGIDPEDPKGERITIDQLISRVENLTDNYNLITIQFGINDYNTQAVTLSEIENSFKNVISRVITKFPEARVVILSPFNTCRRGSASTNYGYKQKHGDKSLEDIALMMEQVCKDTGVEFINMSNGFLFNNYNIQTLQPDQVHPSATGHRLIAKSMVHYLQY